MSVSFQMPAFSWEIRGSLRPSHFRLNEAWRAQELHLLWMTLTQQETQSYWWRTTLVGLEVAIRWKNEGEKGKQLNSSDLLFFSMFVWCYQMKKAFASFLSKCLNSSFWTISRRKVKRFGPWFLSNKHGNTESQTENHLTISLFFIVYVQVVGSFQENLV